MTRSGRAALLAGYVAATFLAFPQPVAGRVLDLGPFAGFAAPMLLLLALRDLAPRAAAGVAFLFCWLAHAAVLHWIYVVTVFYGHAPPPVGVIAPLTLALYPGLCGALFGWALRSWDARGNAAPFAAALLWTALYDHARTFVLTGFPWALLGYAQHANPGLRPLAAFAGVHGLSFVCALGGAGLAALVSGERRAALVAAIGVAAAHALGLALGAPEVPTHESVRVAVLQGNIDQGVKWSEAWRERTLAIYEQLSRDAASRGADVIVWPETAVPGAIEADALVSGRVRSLARETRAWLVVGSVGVDWRQGDRRPSAFYDSAFVLNPQGEFVERYDKTHLVPFGEYVPLRWLLGLFLRSVAGGITPDDVTPGARPRSVLIAPDGDPGFPVGIAVCYELIFPDLVRRFAADGAELLLGITNDAWYGRTGAPYQFLAITALRSAETGLWTARAANTGVSAFIDAAGRVREQTPIFETGLLVADVPRATDPRNATFYVRHGDVFAWACWLGVAAAVIAWRRRVRG